MKATMTTWSALDTAKAAEACWSNGGRLPAPVTWTGLHKFGEEVARVVAGRAPPMQSGHLTASTDKDRSGWLPIETAPDETPVWLIDSQGSMWIGERYDCGDGWFWGNCYLNIYQRSDGTWGSPDCTVDHDYQPTHWQPLPAPPGAAPTPGPDGEKL